MVRLTDLTISILPKLLIGRNTNTPNQKSRMDSLNLMCHYPFTFKYEEISQSAYLYEICINKSVK